MKKVIKIKEKLNKMGAEEGILNLIPTKCNFCSSELAITPTLTGLTCSDKMCVGKRANMLNAMLKDLELKGYGIANCLDIAKVINFATPVQLFILDYNNLPMVDNIDKKIIETLKSLVIDLKSYNKMSFGRFLQLAALPNIGVTMSKKLEEGITKTPQEFLLNVTVEEIQSILKIKQTNSLTSINVTKELLYYQTSLLQALSKIDLEVKEINNDLPVITVCASDGVGGNFAKKQDFYKYIQTALDGKVTVEIKTSVTKTLDYLIWDGGRETSKVTKAKSHIEKGSGIEILDASAFCSKFNI